MKLEIHFIEDKNLNKGSLKEQKTRFKLGFATFNKLFSKVKEVNTLTLYELKKKPQLVKDKILVKITQNSTSKPKFQKTQIFNKIIPNHHIIRETLWFLLNWCLSFHLTPPKIP